MRRGFIRYRASMVSALRPFLGGSTTTTSGLTPFFSSSRAACPASPQKNSAFSMPLRLALSLASSTAWGITSTPMTLPAAEAIARVMVPTPQYRSRTVSFLVISAWEMAASYSRWA